VACHPAPDIPIDRFEIYANDLDHPECLAFDRDGFLWAGGEAGQVYRISPDRRVHAVAELGGFCGGLAWSPDDSELFICNPRHGIVRLNRSGEWSVFAGSVGARRLVCPNYGVFTRSGDYYVTDSGGWRQGNGYLLKFAPGGAGEIVAGPFGFANGLVLSAGEEVVYMVESDTDRVWKISLPGGQAAVHAESVARFPDGLALDSAGNLYVSCYASDNIHRIRPDGGRSLFAYDRWAILLSRPTNLAFSGGHMYVANLGRRSISRAHVGFHGQPLANRS